MLDNASRSRLKLGVDDSRPPVICASGELDHENCQELDKLMQRAIATAGPHLDLSLEGLDFVDSSGVRVLAVTAYNAKKADGLLRIVSIAPQLERLLEVSGFGTLFDIIPTAAEAATVVRPAGGLVQQCSFAIEAKSEACCDARKKVCEFAAGVGFDQPTLDDVKLAVGEALANAVRHGSGPESIVEISCRDNAEGLAITFRYPSSPFDPDAVPIPDIQSAPEGGMGIYFMRLVMDRVDYHFDNGHASLVLEKRVNGNRGLTSH